MKFYYKISQGLRVGLIERLHGLRDPDKQIGVIDIWLTESDSSRVLEKKELSSVFGRLIHRMADSRPMAFLFPNDVAEVAKCLSNINIGIKKKRGWTWIDDRSFQLEEITRILEVGSFTTFYVKIGGESDQPATLSNIVSALDKTHMIIIVALYDETIEILSKHVSPDVVTNILNQIGDAEFIKSSD